ncbi:hypothetical protein KP509_06G085200 [Ceratopteris richardii]|uniref:Acyl carrier protein n=1 Tax=Ceratopteris richardii TaxID=49495 RepID=A0A8T2UIG9_CERRI|nr:hypothetical protein KP509_06G085200 [Ceratopteris richardii]
MASTSVISATVPQLASPPNNALAANVTGRYNGLKCCQLPQRINLRSSTKNCPSRAVRIICQSTIQQVQDIIATQLSVDPSTVQPETKFSELGADSLDTVEIVMSLEEKFGVSIGEQDAENISSVKQVADLIEKQRSI